MAEAHQGRVAIHEQLQGRPNIPGATRQPPQFMAPGLGGPPPTRIMNNAQSAGQQHHVQQPAGQYVRAVPAMVPPQQQQQHQYAAQTAPYVARPNTSVKICDISKEQPLTAEKAREKLSQYFVIRFTRADEGSGYASDGSRRKPSWKRAWRIEDRGISKHEAARMVRGLNRDKIPVMQKKGDLSEEERRQIEMALEDLQKQYDNEYFQTTLVQLDDRVEVKPKEHGKAYVREREKDRKKEKHRKVASKQSASKSRDFKKVVTERVSLTAYFKRTPRPDVDAIAMLRQHEAQREARISQYAQPAARPQVAQYPVPAVPAAPAPPPQPPRQSTPHPPPRPHPPQQNVHGERPGNVRGPGPSGHHAQAYHPQNRGPAVTVIQRKPHEHGNTNARPQTFQRRPSPHVHQRTRAPPSSTDESTYSDGFSDGEDEDTACTSPSTTSSYISQGSYEHPRTAHTPKPVFREGPAHYGIPPNFSRDVPRQAQGTVHIQPHRSNDRRPGFHEQRPSASIPNPNHKPVVHQAALPPVPRPGLFASRQANMSYMTPAQVPTAPSPPPVPMQVHPAAARGGAMGPAPATQAATAPGHHHHHLHIPPPPPAHHHHHISPQAPGQIPVTTAVTHTAATVPGVPPLDPKQLYDNAYAAGREEAIRMAERIAAAATRSAQPHEQRGPVTVTTHRDYPERDHGRGRHRGRSRSRSTSLERSRERGRTRTRSRSRSRSRNRNRNRGRSRSSTSRDSHRSRERRDRDRHRERGRRARSPDRARSREYRDGRHGRYHSRSREERDRIIIRDPVSPHNRAHTPALSRPRSGVRLVRPENGYVRPRVGMDREGIERDMGRLRVSIRNDDDGLEPLDHLKEERVKGGAPYYQGGRRGSFTYGGGASRDRQDLRRRRDSGVHMGAAPLTAANPFTPRSCMTKRTGGAAAAGTHTRYRAPRVDDDFDDSLCY